MRGCGEEAGHYPPVGSGSGLFLPGGRFGLGLAFLFCNLFHLLLVMTSVNDTEPTQKGRGLFTEERSRRGDGVVSAAFTLGTIHPECASRASPGDSLSTRILES